MFFFDRYLDIIILIFDHSCFYKKSPNSIYLYHIIIIYITIILIRFTIPTVYYSLYFFFANYIHLFNLFSAIHSFSLLSSSLCLSVSLSLSLSLSVTLSLFSIRWLRLIVDEGHELGTNKKLLKKFSTSSSAAHRGSEISQNISSNDRNKNNRKGKKKNQTTLNSVFMPVTLFIFSLSAERR